MTTANERASAVAAPVRADSTDRAKDANGRASAGDQAGGAGGRRETAKTRPATGDPADTADGADGNAGMARREIDGEGAGGGPSKRARRSADKPAARKAPVRRLAAGARAALRVAGRAASNAWRDRVLGLAAEAGFWQLLSLPPLLLALLGTIGYIADAVGSDAVNSIRASLLKGASDLLTPEVVDNVVGPTVDQILSRGRPDVISIGFVLSLWTGSTAMATYVNTITIAYGQRDLRSAVRSRLVALRLYIAQVLTGVIILPALVLGPGLLANLFRANRHPVVKMLLEQVFWPAVGLLALAMLTSLYHQSLPQRRPWLSALPGAVFALLGWLLGSYLLRLYLELVFGNELVYGSLAAPVAALLFFYITALAVLLGAELNAALDKRGADSPADADRPADGAGTGTETGDAKRPPTATGSPPEAQSAPPAGSPDGSDRSGS
ncbi:MULTISPECIES: YihY/virulence factor BrkB family protein [unclassified Pseudofrankia]|uniref:YihY/virulence factor BrkB family protein n=1 Tax=unclassified Pseudofrankia TaxID=2994372 RepID=UPI000AD5736A|nr:MULTISPECIES: YihY/virulence factor BrkB family protein [unclassified Pseudofrankia]MDT3443059.1 YihY/virulence factor BrkB family protein [Pseudofrankia sp. BMG5.37]